MSIPVNYMDFYTKAEVARHIIGKSTQTLNKWIKDGKIFAPYSTRGYRTTRHYNLADAMKISLMIHGTIDLEKIYAMLKFDPANPNPYYANTYKDIIGKSLGIVKSDIINRVTIPVDLSPYLQGSETNA